jgi:hypothetical protein
MEMRESYFPNFLMKGLKMKKSTIALLVASALSAPAVYANTFTNGGFEAGDLSGWTGGGGTWSGSPAFPVNPAVYNGGTPNNVVMNGGVDPITGASRVYGGTFSVRVNDSVNNYSVSTLRQSVANYTDNDIFFAWNAVLEGSHGLTDSDYFSLTLRDDTAGSNLVSRSYSSASATATFTRVGGWYTSGWQVEHIDVAGLGAIGHDFTLTLLASDCPYGGHAGYVYLDGFGGVTPPTGNDGQVPVPATLALLGLGVLGMGATRRRNA